MRLASNLNKSLACLAVAVSLVSVTASNAVAVQQEPYEARVATPGASVHSGPGDSFYTTDTLPQGEVVEVYREAPGGWLGICPPQDSFSWVFGAHVKRLDGSLAEIDKDDVASRIGSRLGSQKNAVQVRLRKGEVVEIVGEAVIEGKKWYRISPPSGEFRWIHARHVEHAPATDSVASAEPVEARNPPVVTVPVGEPAGTQKADRDDESKPASDSESVTPEADSQPERDPEWRAAPIQSADQSSATDASPQSIVAGQSPSESSTTGPTVAADASAQRLATAVAPPAAKSEQPASSSTQEVSITPIPGDDLARQLTDIELRLSRLVAEPPVTWQIEPLRREVEQLIAQTTSETDLSRLKSTIAKLDRFAAIAQKYQQSRPIGRLPTSAGSGDPRTMSSSGTPSTNTQHRSAELIAGPTPDTSRYDAVGTLRPVVSKRPGAPQFALVDERGQVISFVTPSPDVNLQPYVGHRIGVTGSRGFIPEFQRSHVTAGRVAPLGGRLVR